MYLRVLFSERRDGEDVRDVRYVRALPVTVQVDTLRSHAEPELPAFPPGDWGVADVARNGATGAVEVVEARARDNLLLGQGPPPPRVDAWHPVSVDYLDLEGLRQLPYAAVYRRRSDSLRLVSHRSLLPVPVPVPGADEDRGLPLVPVLDPGRD